TTCSLATNRDAANLGAERGVDDLLHDVTVGGKDGRGSNDTNAQAVAAVPMAMVMRMPGGSGGGGERGSADNSGCTASESDLAKLGGSPVRGLVLGGWGHHILPIGRRVPGKGSKALFERISERAAAPIFHAVSWKNVGFWALWLAQNR